MSEIELKACPFCGSQAVIYFWQDEDLWSHNIVEWQKVRCTGCECEGQSSCEGFEESETAVAVWNTRAPQWQPIETAPKDGAEVDLWHPKLGRITGSNWDTYMERWTILCDSEGPTHFMLPPAAPEASA